MFLTPREQFDFKPMGYGRVVLQSVLCYQDGECGLITVTAGFDFDLASYGPISGAIFDKLGKSMRAATLHDWLYRNQPKGITRAMADRIYREALILEGSSKRSAWVQWSGVRVGGWAAWNTHARALKKVSSEK